MRSNNTTNLIFAFLRQTQLWAAHITLTIMVGSLFFQVLARQMRWQLDWTEELARFSFIAMIFVAASYATQTGAHLRVEFFSDLISKMGRTSRWIVSQLQWCAVLTFDVLFTWYSIENLKEGFRYPNLSPTLNFNENILFLAPAIGFSAAIIFTILSRFVEAPGLQTPSSGEITP
ncbi:TRAP transporter small permease [Sneathiella litorea]|uniref:TRAP transporter small permease protein n=1 Tax=Sneathiella litorea TaxID=2606216 RepID=A0A6L8WAH1_9PROT|nr:TRAP transporter small permease [Sneathiella litorea]MZR31644.1 TRAP transporter small permease subunit [Sneathiella litorea]